MDSKALTSATFLLTLNLLFFSTLVSSTYSTTPLPQPPPKVPNPLPPTPASSPPPEIPNPLPPTPSSSPPIESPMPLPLAPTPTPPMLHCPNPLPPTPASSPPPKIPNPLPPTPSSSPPIESPMPLPLAPTPTPPMLHCPKDTLKLGVCANLLSNLVNLVIGTPTTSPCCTLIGGLVDLDAAVCLCTAIKAGVLGINLNIPIDLSLLLNYCGKKVPTGFQCA